MRQALALFVLAVTLHAQGQVNRALSSYNVNGLPNAVVGQASPIERVLATDCPVTLELQSWPKAGGFPVIMLFDTATTLGNTLLINAWNQWGLQVDLRDKHGNGYTGDQILFDGFARPDVSTWSDIGGRLSTSITLPACNRVANQWQCMTAANTQSFEVSTQAIVYDPTAPFGLTTTALVRGTFTNGYQEFNLSGNQSATFNFRNGFSFPFYGVTYTSVKVSANGFISFGPITDTSFPQISLASVRSGIPRIMSLFTDLEPQVASYQPATRVYAQQFSDANGVRKVRFGHEYLAEFGDATGPHGGEIVITENGDIAVYVSAYQIAPTINTAVGITPGGNIGSSLPAFGRDLSSAYGTQFALGAGGQGFELFDLGAGGSGANPLDLIGAFDNQSHPVGRGVVFLKDTSLANTAPANSGYIIQ